MIERGDDELSVGTGGRKEIQRGGEVWRGKTEEEREWLQVSLGPVRWCRCHKHVLSIFSAFSAHSPECEEGEGGRVGGK